LNTDAIRADADKKASYSDYLGMMLNLDVEADTDQADEVATRFENLSNMGLDELEEFRDSTELSEVQSDAFQRAYKLKDKDVSDWEEEDVRDGARASFFIARMKEYRPEDSQKEEWVDHLKSFGYDPEKG